MEPSIWTRIDSDRRPPSFSDACPRKHALRGIEDYEQPTVVIGEGEGNKVYARVPGAARAYGAIYFSFGTDENGKEVNFTKEEWTGKTDSMMWVFNWAWITAMKNQEALFYDIGTYAARDTRGKSYLCERLTLEGYPDREERWFGATGTHVVEKRCDILFGS